MRKVYPTAYRRPCEAHGTHAIATVSAVPGWGGWESGSSGKLFEQTAETKHRLADVQAALHRPHAGRHRMDHRDFEILLQRLDDIHHSPAGAQHVDRLRTGVLQEGALRVGI